VTREVARLAWIMLTDWLFAPVDLRICKWANDTHEPDPKDTTP
jgi:hypothetical protein